MKDDNQGGGGSSHLETFFESIRGAFLQSWTVINHIFVFVFGFDGFAYCVVVGEKDDDEEGGGGLLEGGMNVS